VRQDFWAMIVQWKLMSARLSLVSMVGHAMIRLMALFVSAPMDLQVCSAKKTLTTANPIRVKMMACAQIWFQITPVLVSWVSTAITVKTVLTTAEQPTAASMASVLTLALIFTATAEVDTSVNTASLK